VGGFILHDRPVVIITLSCLLRLISNTLLSIPLLCAITSFTNTYNTTN
jgi:hypothetical protein